MTNKLRFLALSAASLIILSGCNNNINTLQPLQNNQTVTQQNTKSESKYNTAKDSIWIAQSTARRWDISAELVKAEGNWVNEDGSSRWTYYFKSPFQMRVLRVDASGYSQEVPNSFFGSEIRDFDWRVDSNSAIELAKDQGLKNFPVSQMTLERKFATTEWELRTYNGIFRVDAERSKLVAKNLKK